MIELRVLRTADELAVMPPFERKIWGVVDEVVSVNMLVACLEEGGVAIGAFVGEQVVGTVFGFRTHEERVLHSHYMAVDPEYRRHGLGEQLKRRQAEWCVDNGVTAMRWTFDPLQLANAHLNLNRLGAIGVSYHVNHYGTMGGLNGGLPSDRLTVQWELTRPRTRALPGLDSATEWLRTRIPEAGGVSVVHGDYKLDNVMFGATEPTLIAIFDWEMATIGDPLADLGWLLSTWGDPGDPPGTRRLNEAPPITTREGFLSGEEMAARYEAKSGRSMKHFAFYHTLAVYKLAIILEGLYMHFLEKTASNPGAAEFEWYVPVLVDRMHRIMGE